MRHAYPCAGTPPSARLPLQPSQRASVARSAQIARDLRQHRARPGFLRQAADDGLFRLARHPRAALAALLRAAEMQNQPFSARADHGAEVAPLAGFHLMGGIPVDGEVEILERQCGCFQDCLLGRREKALLHAFRAAGFGFGILAAGQRRRLRFFAFRGAGRRGRLRLRRRPGESAVRKPAALLEFAARRVL